MLSDFNNYLGKLKKKNGDKLLPKTIEEYLYYIEQYENKLQGKDGEVLVEVMNNILKQKNNIVIYSAFKNYLAFTGIPKDCDLARKLIKPEKTASAITSVRALQSKILSRQELKRIFNESNDETRLIFSFLYDTAVRRNELLNIKFGDIVYFNKDKDKSNIYAKINVLGKGAKSRTVYIGKTTYDLLMKLRPEQNKDEKVFVFYDKGGNLLSKQDDKVYNIIKNNIKKILGRNFSTHNFRHTKLTHLSSKGSDILGVSKYAGHSGTAVTQVYIHASDSLGRNAFEKFSEEIGEDFDE